MTIVPIGNLFLQVPESGSKGFAIEIIRQIRHQVVHLASRVLKDSLETELDRFLGREKPARTKLVETDRSSRVEKCQFWLLKGSGRPRDVPN